MAALAVRILKNTGCQRFHRIPSASTHGEAGSSAANWQCKSNEVSSSIIVQHNRSPWLQSVMGICYFIKSLLFSVRPSLQDGYCDVRSNTRPRLRCLFFVRVSIDFLNCCITDQYSKQSGCRSELCRCCHQLHFCSLQVYKCKQ